MLWRVGLSSEEARAWQIRVRLLERTDLTDCSDGVVRTSGATFQCSADVITNSE